MGRIEIQVRSNLDQDQFLALYLVRRRLKWRTVNPRKRAGGAEQEAEKRRPEGAVATEAHLNPYYKTRASSMR